MNPLGFLVGGACSAGLLLIGASHPWLSHGLWYFASIPAVMVCVFGAAFGFKAWLDS